MVIYFIVFYKEIIYGKDIWIRINDFGFMKKGYKVMECILFKIFGFLMIELICFRVWVLVFCIFMWEFVRILYKWGIILGRYDDNCFGV